MPSATIVTCFPLSESDADIIRDAASDNFDVIVANQETISKEIFKADIFCGHAKVPVDWQQVATNGQVKVDSIVSCWIGSLLGTSGYQLKHFS